MSNEEEKNVGINADIKILINVIRRGAVALEKLEKSINDLANKIDKS